MITDFYQRSRSVWHPKQTQVGSQDLDICVGLNYDKRQVNIKTSTLITTYPSYIPRTM